MPDEAATTDRQGAFAAHPGYRITFEPTDRHLIARQAGQTIVDSRRVMVLRETRHRPVYYVPREDVRMDLMRATEHRTYCPFKGHASYWSLVVKDGATLENVMWSYEAPFEEVASIRDWVAFYHSRFDEWIVQDAAQAPARAAAPAVANPLADWLIRDGWDTNEPDELVVRLANAIQDAAGIPLLRLFVSMWALHPLTLGTGFTWSRGAASVVAYSAPHELLDDPEFRDAPIAPVLQGEGPVRFNLAETDFQTPGLLADLKALGGTDYIGLPLPYSDGRLTALALTTDAPGGFTDAQLLMLKEVAPLLGRLFEVHALRQTTINLLDTYLGAHAGERVYHGLIKRGDGENIRAVIWFSDLRGSTELSENLSQSAYLWALNQFLEAMAGAVIDAGGTVLKFIGDEVLGIFPIDPELGATAEAAAQAAMAAARNAETRLAAVNDIRVAKGQPALEHALALHVGDVMYGNVGAPSRLDFTVVGRAINEASRLEQLTRDAGRSVLVSQAFASICAEELEHIGSFSLRGLRAMQDVYGLCEQT